MSYTAQGKLVALQPERVISDKFRVREFVLEIEDGKYSQTCSFQASNDRIEELSKYTVGDTLKVEFNLRGRAWNPPNGDPRKYFNTLDAWKLERVGEASSQPAEDGGGDDLPF